MPAIMSSGIEVNTSNNIDIFLCFLRRTTSSQRLKINFLDAKLKILGKPNYLRVS